MTKRLIFWGLALLLAHMVAAEPDYTEYARVLSAYVTDTGVDYEAWSAHKEDVAALDSFLDQLAGVNPAGLAREAQKAFYINLYNAAMLQAVLERYPLKSVKAIGLVPFSIFKQQFIRLGERRLSLDEVEKGILLKVFSDPRIHFAVNCASRSCPPLRAEPFVAERLDAQLDAQARLFAASEQAARVDFKTRRVAYSKLFKWYAEDFGVVNPAEYLNRYREVDLPDSYQVDWLPYDWSLNASYRP